MSRKSFRLQLGVSRGMRSSGNSIFELYLYLYQPPACEEKSLGTRLYLYTLVSSGNSIFELYLYVDYTDGIFRHLSIFELYLYVDIQMICSGNSIFELYTWYQALYDTPWTVLAYISESDSLYSVIDVQHGSKAIPTLLRSPGHIIYWRKNNRAYFKTGRAAFSRPSPHTKENNASFGAAQFAPKITIVARVKNLLKYDWDISFIKK